MNIENNVDTRRDSQNHTAPFPLGSKSNDLSFNCHFNNKFKIIDGIGFGDPVMPNKEIINQLKKDFKGEEIDIIMFVIKMGRISQETLDIFNLIEQTIYPNGSASSNFLLCSTHSNDESWFEENIHSQVLKPILSKCNLGYIGVDFPPFNLNPIIEGGRGWLRTSQHQQHRTYSTTSSDGNTEVSDGYITNKSNTSSSIMIKPQSFNLSQNVYSKPLRRVIFNVPGNDQRKVAKAVQLSGIIDTIVLDIEDGVAANMKQAAREEIARSVQKDSYSKSELLVRVNSVDSGLLEDDIKAMSKIANYIDGFLIPKVESPAHLQYVTHLMRYNGITDRKKLLASIESAIGLINLKDICQYHTKAFPGEQSMLEALVFASEDYCADTGITRTPEASELSYARSAVVNHAIAFGLQAIDMVCINFKDLDVLRKEAKEGVQMGFHGKQAIHPGQIEVICDAFRPTLKQVQFASRIIDQNEINQSMGKGAFEVDGKMIDLPMVKWAQNIQHLESNYPPRESYD
ncbi:citrate lyase subunit beta-like protein [Cavenderia fasciculata]|uniref:Citrate lyase subunit beta-like protein n=1 Tax=Cavenderia fasciculata TaxID=261658 RepID=F4PSD1_CACFS|nr:citrate lyase subunit beta-like protein [Cavenderia fasciculata]EGG20677.1 citrate lyase subunit beta-like protein [Cavenderia fasciculata]|eukprot:XP_004358527.1 citrate lyase subunit beta-like protein [Cavenderia fasciculata]